MKIRQKLRRIGLGFIALLCVFALVGCADAYMGELGGEYEISSVTVKRKNVPVSFQVGGGTVLEGTVTVVYAYEI